VGGGQGDMTERSGAGRGSNNGRRSGGRAIEGRCEGAGDRKRVVERVAGGDGRDMGGGERVGVI